MLSTITVTGTGDSTDVGDGFVTLREAITSFNNGANFNADVTAVGTYGVSDTINFNIAGASVQTISPSSPLPTILKPVAINGYSQSGTSTNTLANSDNAVLLIQLDGTNAGLVGANGLLLGTGSGGSSVSGLVVNRFSGAGILVQSDSNTITGNFLGTDAAGNAGVSTTSGFGIGIEGGFRNTIGGTAPAARNVIGGNSDGINLNTGSQNNVIQGNFIGLGADGATAVGNRLHGVALRGNGGLGVQNNLIGGTVAGAGNTITNNGAAGVAVFGDATVNPQNSGNAILGNSIFNNGLNSPATLPGIDLVGATSISYPTDDGVTLNVSGDGDSGPNLLQNFPVLTSVTSDLVSTTIVGTLNSNSNTTYRIEFFSSPTVSGTGFGDGQTFLGFTNVTTNASGNVSFNTTVATSVPNGQFVTATATSEGTNTGAAPGGAASIILGTAANFAVLASSTVTITGPTTLIGDVGVFAGSVISGTFRTTGTIHAADPVSEKAQLDLTAGYNFLAGITPFIDLTGTELGGLTLTPGVYRFSTSAQLTGPLPLTLDTQGDPHALFVFQIGSTLTTSAGVGSSVVVLGGSDRIFWQVGSSATIGVGTAFAGNILALASITLETGATLASGRALARTGAVTLDTIVVDSTSTTSSQNNTSEFSAALQISIPTISINDFAVLEGNSGTTNAVFTVTLSAASLQTVTVVATSANNTAISPSGYTALPPTTLTFVPGETSKTVTVSVNGDTLVEPTETFFVNLSTATNATIADNRGLGTIINDDPVTRFVGLVDDPEHPGQKMLMAVGTIGNDTLDFLSRLSSHEILVRLNRVNVGVFDANLVGRIVAFGLAGNDRIRVNSALGKSVELHGDAGNDTLYGDTGDDVLFGGDGNDDLYGRDGDDRLFGEAGNDHLYGGAGQDILLGGSGKDTLSGDTGNDDLFGGDGDDDLHGRSGDDRLFGEGGNDRLYGAAGQDILLGGSDNDKLYGQGGDDILLGGSGNDQLYGQGGRDILIGGLGTDQLYGQGGGDILIGGTTAHDANETALVAIRAEWTSGNDYATRVANIRAGLGLSAGFRLSAGVTVTDDGVIDELFSGGTQDWFFNFGAANDKLRGKKANELIN